jgi:iron complex outermembrane receptor protein
MRKYLLILSFVFVPFESFAQDLDTLKSVVIKEVTVTAYKEESFKETSLNISGLKIDSLTKYGNYNLTDLLAKVPGVNILGSGVAIAKPVIRGLYGNRVLVLISGLKFDNQQWQEEHGLGLSDIGLSKVELIKGPMSVLYGTEAIGGIINLIEEDKPAINTRESDFSVKTNTNTLGGLVQAGYKVNYGKKWFRIRAGVENNADYSDGKNSRVLNSRFDAYYLKSSFGFQRKNWISNNNYLGSFNRFGFIFNDIYDFVQPDARYSRKLNLNPYHLVILNMLSSENKILLKNNSKLTINAGIQSNERMENEGGGAISLNMHLFTAQYLIKWEKKLNNTHKLIVSNLGSFEDNTNFGARKIVPDANMQESNLSVYYETNFNGQLILENGIGAGEKWIKTYFTATVNGPEKEVHPFNKFSPYYNAFTGLSFIPNSHFNLKLNAATGVRIPNLAELSSNGLHEGVFTFEIGYPMLKNEQNISLNLALNYEQKFFQFYASPFYNFFNNYVYLAPTTEDWFGFPVFRYKQQNATQYGTECTINLMPVNHLLIGSSYAAMISKTADGNYTPFIPAQKIAPKTQYQLQNIKKVPLTIFTAADIYMAQNKVYAIEKTTPSYWLLNAGISTVTSIKNTTYEISIVGNNLLNVAYYDHLSRFKNYGLLNIGRNIVLMIKVKFNTPVKVK